MSYQLLQCQIDLGTSQLANNVGLPGNQCPAQPQLNKMCFGAFANLVGQPGPAQFSANCSIQQCPTGTTFNPVSGTCTE